MNLTYPFEMRGLMVAAAVAAGGCGSLSQAPNSDDASGTDASTTTGTGASTGGTTSGSGATTTGGGTGSTTTGEDDTQWAATTCDFLDDSTIRGLQVLSSGEVLVLGAQSTDAQDGPLLWLLSAEGETVWIYDAWQQPPNAALLPSTVAHAGELPGVKKASW